MQELFFTEAPVSDTHNYIDTEMHTPVRCLWYILQTKQVIKHLLAILLCRSNTRPA